MEPEKQRILIAILAGTAFVLLFGFFTFLVVLSYVKRKRKLLLEKKIREAHFQQELLQAQLEMQDHTFRTVSQEIHDNVGQILSLAKVNLNILAMNGNGSEQLHDVKEMVNSAILELRNLSMGYYADRVVETGLVEAIRILLNQLDKMGIFATGFHSELEHISISRNKTIFLYRMVQEALNNVVKHAHSDRVDIHIFNRDDGLHIVLTDNGKGFDVNGADFKPGIGISSMRQRAAMIGAQFAITSKPGKGTTVHLIYKPQYD